MKTITMSIIAMCSVVFMNAQTTQPSGSKITFGIKAGGNVSNLTGTTVTNNEAKVGAYGGVFVEIPITEKLSVQPEAMFSMEGARWEDLYVNIPIGYNTVDKNKANLNYVNIPIMAKYYFSGGFYVEIGPQFGVLVSAKVENENQQTLIAPPNTVIVNTTTIDIKSSLSGLNFGAGIGTGYQFQNGFNVNARYIIGISDIDTASSTDLRTSNFSLGIGYTL